MTRYECNKCGGYTKDSTFKYHQCARSFSSLDRQLALYGDLEHKLFLSKYFYTIGINFEMCASVHNFFYSNQHQSEYMRLSWNADHIKNFNGSSIHKLGTLFELLYHTDVDFMETYNAYIMSYTKDSLLKLIH